MSGHYSSTMERMAQRDQEKAEIESRAIVSDEGFGSSADMEERNRLRREQEEAANWPDNANEPVASFGDANDVEADGFGSAPVTDNGEFNPAPGFSEPIDPPGIGTALTYFPRQGEGRMGRKMFPAQVHYRHEDGSIDLIVFYDADDVIRVERIKQRSETNQYGAWNYPENVTGVESDSVAELRDALDDLRTMIMGDYNRPPIAVFEIFAKLEQRVKDLEAKK